MSANTTPPKRWGWLLLFATTTTLLCCALPIVLVGLGLGAVVAAMAANLPFLIGLSLHKGWVFAGTGLLLIAGYRALYRRGRSCPADPALAKLCDDAHRWNHRLYWASVLVFSVGFFFAYIAQYLF